IGRQLNELGEANGALERQNSRFQNIVDDIIKRTGVSAITGGYGGGGAGDEGSGAANRAFAKLVSDREDALRAIRDLDEEYASMTFDDDESEMQALRRKFRKFREVIEDENKKIAEWNAK